MIKRIKSNGDSQNEIPQLATVSLEGFRFESPQSLLSVSSSLQLDAQGSKLSEVIITIDTPVYNITDQTGFIDLVREAVLTVNQDNAFMTLIDYDNIELVLPSLSGTNNYKAEPMLCCHSCPDGHAYRLGHCGKRYGSLTKK